MILSKNAPRGYFEIWQPRWKDRVVLLATYKVSHHNEIRFTKAPTLPGSYYVSGDVAKNCPVETNGTISCYAVPMTKIEPLEDKDDE